MTAQRHDGTDGTPAPAPRRRAGQRRGGLRAAAARPQGATGTEPASESAPPAPVEAPAPPPPATPKSSTTKYTALLDDVTALAFDELALVARRKLRRKVDKSQLMRALILLAADDASLRDQVIDHVSASTSSR